MSTSHIHASEVELLGLLCSWIEVHHQTTREPCRKSKKFDRYDEQKCSPFLALIRIPHIFPAELDNVDSGLKRRFLPELSHRVTKFSHWDSNDSDGLYKRPRLFQPYAKECKKLLDDRFCLDDSDHVSGGGSSGGVGGGHSNILPDALYMLHEDSPCNLGAASLGKKDFQTVPQMLRRSQFLLNSIPVQRMIRHSAGITHDEIRHLVYLRIVRECGLPDSYTNVLKKADDDHQKAQHQAAALAAAASSASGTLGRCVGSTSSRSSSMLTATMDSRRQTFHQQLAQTSSHRSLVQDEIEILETNIGGSSLGGATSITLLSSGAMAGPSTPLSSMGRRKKFPGSDCSNNTKGHALPNRSPDLIGTATAAAAAAGSSSPEFKRRL